MSDYDATIKKPRLNQWIGATALAALTSGAYVADPGERVAILVCGGNCDPATVAG